MRRAVCLVALLAACAIFAAPAAAQTPTRPMPDHWFLSAGIGPSFGTFGSTAAIDTAAGYRFSDHLSLAGEFGVLPHAPFDKASSVAAPVVPPAGAMASDVHVNGYRVNANLYVSPSTMWGRVSPYVTGGIGSFTGSTVARFNTGPTWVRRYESDTNFATNLGAGLGYRINRWFGVNADYRHFIVDAADTQHVNRFTTGVSLFIK